MEQINIKQLILEIGSLKRDLSIIKSKLKTKENILYSVFTEEAVQAYNTLTQQPQKLDKPTTPTKSGS